MGHGSYGSWVKCPMGHMGRGSLSVTHCQLCAGAMMAEARQFDAGVPTVGLLWSGKRRPSVGSQVLGQRKFATCQT
jgi:hypothetical protein